MSQESEALKRLPLKLKRSPNLEFYIDAVRAGWNVRQLERQAKKLFNEDISRCTFHRLVKLIPKDGKVDPTYRETVLKGIDAMIEPLTELQNLIEVQKKRVTEAVRFERNLATAGQGGGVIPIESTRREIELLWQMLNDYARFLMDVGILDMMGVHPLKPSVQFSPPPVEDEEDIGEFLKRLSDEDRVWWAQMNQRLSGIILEHFLICKDPILVGEYFSAEIK